MISPETLAVVAVGALVFFGGKKIPELAKGLGEGIREFRKGAASTDEAPTAPPLAAAAPVQLPQRPEIIASSETVEHQR